ncbi:MqnA/MqnD/SBP family protein [Sulfurovum mangrovi]|uniref:MqnA/MqnD/SBP family protein n=1 Tax=Sulfurovum mangrovi TaxID=2893889 RepID=UPI001E2892D6|nr:MqnA/MqnD/SBP family protein [Sulfurovum mangrovi]UFH59376.1 hypothetical protein LN246_00645 [Sulfurovum mangrovi]
MLFGSISYLNLLPFQLFLKKHIRSNAAKMAFGYKRAVPSQINASLKRGEVNAAFISSIESRRRQCTDLGIIANKKVYSVFVIPGKEEIDPASATSNRLAKVLDLKGQVLIGDQALKYYLSGGEGIDLAEAWYAETKLPFVFARLCYNRHKKNVEALAKEFAHTKVRIPQYMLKREAKKRGITPKEVLWYLEHINYTMDYRSKKALKLFLTRAHKKH